VTTDYISFDLGSNRAYSRLQMFTPTDGDKRRPADHCNKRPLHPPLPTARAKPGGPR